MGLLAAAGLLLLSGGLVGILRVVQAAGPVELPAVSALPSPTPGPSTTPTPFQPLKPTPTILPTYTRIPTATATLPPTPVPHFAARLLDESAGPVTLEIDPPDLVHQGQAIRLTFQPGHDCPFGSGVACVSQHHQGKVVMLTVHSGLGGQSETFRRAVEGTGLDTAFFNLDKIHENLRALRNTPVRLTIDGQTRDNLELVGVARVPPDQLQAYFDLPGDEALALAAHYDDQVLAALQAGEQLLAFEVCGWAVPGEPWAPGVSATTASIYLGFIRDR
jgi:hypothetical protein